MTKRILMFVLSLLLLEASAVETVRACRCAAQGAAAAYRRADLVVVARVFAVKALDAPGSFTLTLDVQEAWKAATSNRVQVTTSEPCAYSIDDGSVHLLFIKTAPTGQLATSLCAGNGALASRKEAYAWLKKHGARKSVLPNDGREDTPK